MGSYRLSVSAEADLISIDAYSEREFGKYQVEAYVLGLERTFGSDVTTRTLDTVRKCSVA